MFKDPSPLLLQPPRCATVITIITAAQHGQAVEELWSISTVYNMHAIARLLSMIIMIFYDHAPLKKQANIIKDGRF